MAKFEDHWTTILSSSGDGGDILASIREEAVNHYLSKHFDLDKPKYSVIKTLVGKVDDGGTTKDVPIKITISAKSPLIMDLQPFSAGNKVGGGWNHIDAPEAPPNLTQGNVRLRVDQLAFSVEWQSVYSPGVKYTWSPSPILLEAETRIELRSVGEPIEEARHYLLLQPLKARFARPVRAVIEQELRALIARLPAADAAIVTKHAVDKFDELLVIALNTAAADVIPRFATSIEIPVPIVAQKRVIPRNLLVSDDIITVSLGLDEARLRSDVERSLSRALAEIDSALEEDVEAAGGLRQLVFNDPDSVDWDSIEAIRSAEIIDPIDVAKKLARTTQISQRHEARASGEIRRWEARSPAGALAAQVKDGVGVAINEYFMDSLAATFTRSSSGCTSWLDLAAVRGRACYWTRIFDPDVTVGASGGKLTIKGAIAVDVGGSLEACVRKFWDCSWRWACSELRMAVTGRPGIELSVLANKYVAFTAKIIGTLRLETNLPFPFDKIIGAVSALVWEAVKAVLNAVLAHVQIVIVPPRIELPKQKTGITLSDFAGSWTPRKTGSS